MNIILASASPRRRELLKKTGLKFKVKKSSVIEKPFDGTTSPESYALGLAREKAHNIIKKYKTGIVIGADTIVVLNKAVLSKPEDENDAEKMLNLLSGTSHTVITALYIHDIESGNFLSDYEATKVLFEKLDNKEIKDYIKTREPLDKAGSYGIQGKGARFIRKIEGCYTNVVGLPLNKTYKMLSVINPGLFNEEKNKEIKNALAGLKNTFKNIKELFILQRKKVLLLMKSIKANFKSKKEDKDVLFKETARYNNYLILNKLSSVNDGKSIKNALFKIVDYIVLNKKTVQRAQKENHYNKFLGDFIKNNKNKETGIKNNSYGTFFDKYYKLKKSIFINYYRYENFYIQNIEDGLVDTKDVVKSMLTLPYSSADTSNGSENIFISNDVIKKYKKKQIGE
jgi:septum formation protein